MLTPSTQTATNAAVQASGIRPPERRPIRPSTVMTAPRARQTPPIHSVSTRVIDSMDELSFASIRTALETSISPIMPMTMAKPAGLRRSYFGGRGPADGRYGDDWYGMGGRAGRSAVWGWPKPYPGAGCWNG